MGDHPTEVVPRDKVGLLELEDHPLANFIRQRLTQSVEVIHPFEKPDRLPDRVEVLGRHVLRAHAQVLELSDRGEDLLADGSDVLQEPLVRGRCHKEGLYLDGRLEG